MPIDPKRRRRNAPKAPSLTRDDAERVAIQTVAYLAGREELFLRFMSLTGTNVDAVRGGITDPAMLGAVLDFVLADEKLVLEVAQELNLEPDVIARVRALLPGAPLVG